MPFSAARVSAGCVMRIFYTDQYSGSRKDGERKRRSRFLLEKVLYDCCGIPKKAEVLSEQRGRRYIDPVYGVDFSVTHTGNFWICAVSEKRCGIDAELRTRNFSSPEKLAERFLTEAEQQYLQSEKSGSVSEGMLYLWTRKEAYLKYTGDGLYGLHCAPSVTDSPEGTRIRTWYGNSLCLSVCVPEGEMREFPEMIDIMDAHERKKRNE